MSHCEKAKLEEMNESHFTKKFVGTKSFTDAVYDLAVFAEPDQMRVCNERFQKKILDDIESVSDKVDDCYYSHWNSEAWQEYWNITNSKSMAKQSHNSKSTSV